MTSAVGTGAIIDDDTMAGATECAWGNNGCSQLGLGDHTNRDSPVQAGSDAHRGTEIGFARVAATRLEGPPRRSSVRWRRP